MRQYIIRPQWFVGILLVISCHSNRIPATPGFSEIKLSAKEQQITTRLFPLIETLNENPPGLQSGFNSSQYKVMAASISKRYEDAVRNCNDGVCLAKAFSVSAEEINFISRISTNSKGDNQNVKQGIPDVVIAINYIFDVYLAGKKPRYPKIDGASFTNDDREYIEKVKQAVIELRGRNGAKDVIYGLPWLTALKLLELNGRDEGARYEPLAQVNNAAYKKLASTSWDKYKFSAILVPGLGPQNLTESLDPRGAKRCDLAAAQFNKGEAPFIIVSGGHVHPDKTPFSEAIEMKNYLVSTLKIPLDAVIVEPYARHTTTNIRNASRLVFALNMPPEKPLLIATDFFQTTYIPMMKRRFMEELGYLPYQEISKSKAGGIFFIPDISAMKINPLDPLDP